MSAHARRFWLVLATLVVAEITSAFETSMISVALAHLYGVYGDPVRVTWLITAFSLTAAATAAIGSRLGDLYGRRRMLVIMLVLSAVGSLISALASDLNIIILGRALQGASISMLPLAFGILRETAKDSKELNVGVGVLGGTYSFSTGTGIVLGGVIVDRADWQDMFLLSGGVAIAALVMVLIVLPRDKPRTISGPLDLVGGVTLVIPITALLLALNSGKAEGWDSPMTLGLLFGGVVGLAAWVRYELRQADPMINVRLLKKPQIALVNLVICTCAMGPMIYPQVMMPLLQQPMWTGVGLGITATMAGLAKLPTNLTSGVAAIASGYIAHRFTMRMVVIWAMAANLLAWLLLIRWHDSMWYLVLAAVLLVAPSATIIFGVAPGLIIEATPEERTSEATGMTAVLRSIAQAVGSQLIALCLATSAITNAAGTRFPDEKAYVVSFVYVAACCALSLLFAFMIPRPRSAKALAPALAE